MDRTGDVVYLLDPGEVLERYCNTEMVYLETPQEEDFKIIRRDLRQHLAYTGSRRALGILSHWETVVPRYAYRLSEILPNSGRCEKAPL